MFNMTEALSKINEIREKSPNLKNVGFNIGKELATSTDGFLANHSPSKCPERVVTHTTPDRVVPVYSAYTVDVGPLTYIASKDRVRMYCDGHSQPVCENCNIKERGITLPK
jgi:hypothetical protein